jgi:hypothetical protein
MQPWQTLKLCTVGEGRLPLHPVLFSSETIARGAACPFGPGRNGEGPEAGEHSPAVSVAERQLVESCPVLQCWA